MESFDGSGETRNAPAQGCGRGAPYGAERASRRHMRGNRVGGVRISGTVGRNCDGRLEPVKRAARNRVSDVSARGAEQQQRECQCKLSRDPCPFCSCGHAEIPVGIRSARRRIALTVANWVKRGPFVKLLGRGGLTSGSAPVTCLLRVWGGWGQWARDRGRLARSPVAMCYCAREPGATWAASAL